MKKFLALLLAGLAPVSVYAEETGRYLLVHSSHQPVNARGCPDKRLSISVHDREEVAREEGRRLRNMPGQVDHATDILPPGRYSIVYAYQSRSGLYASDCVFRQYAVMTGDDERDAKQRLERYVGENKRYVPSSVETIRTWTGGGLRKLSRDYDGVVVSYLTSIKDGTTAVHAQVRNTNPGRKALLRFQVNGVPQPNAVELMPGHSANVPLGRDVRQFGAVVQLVHPDETASPSFLQRLQKELREQITVKDGLVETDPACNCVRG